MNQYPSVPKRLASLILIFCLLPGCATTEFQYGGSTFSRTSFGTTTSIGTFDLAVDKDGVQRVHIEQAATDQVQGLKAVAEGVAQGITKGVKP